MLKCAALLPLALAAPAFAQADDPDDDVIVTASRSGEAEKAADIPASLTVIDDAALEERQTRIVSDVLRDVPGVAVSRAGGVGALTQVRIRGSESNHVLVLIDGIEASDPYQGEFDFGTLLAGEGARIEVLRGQQSSLYGSDAVGGVIQYVTLSGAEAPGIRLRVEGGSFGTGAGSARWAGVTGNLDYALSGSAYGTGGFPTARGGSRDIGSFNAAASAKLAWAPTDTFKLTAVGRYSHVAADNNLSDLDPASPTFGLIVDSPGNRFRVNSAYGLLKGELSLMDGRWINALTAQIADSDRRNFTQAGLDFGDEGRRYKASFESALRFGGGAVRHRLTAAVDVEREEFRSISASPFVFTGERHIDNVGLVAAYDLDLGEALALDFSARRDLNTRFADATTWRAQGGCRVASGTRMRGAYATGIKNPSYFELYGYFNGRYIGNPGLRPEKSKGWEAGLDQSLGETATIGVTYFDSRLDDEIYTVPTPDFGSTSLNQISRSYQHGVEAFVSATPNDRVRVDFAYTYTKARDGDGVEVRRPKHIGSVNVTAFTGDKRLSGTLTVRYNGAADDLAFTDPTFVPVRVSLDAYTLVNLAVDYRLSDRVALFGRVENALDEDYEEVFSYRGTGRAAYAGLKASL